MARRNPTELNARERRFIDNIRMGMAEPAAVAAAGWTEPSKQLKILKRRPIVQQELALAYRDAREKANVTRDEVLEGFKDAIQDAKLLGDPHAQIKGWSEIGKMCGFYAAEKKEIHLSREPTVLEQQLADLSTEGLLELAGHDSLEVIEGEFEHVKDA